MSFDAFAAAPIADLIDAAGARGKVSLLVGEGASMEAASISNSTRRNRTG